MVRLVKFILYAYSLSFSKSANSPAKEFAREALGQKEIDMDNIETVSAEEYTQVVEPDEAQVEALAEYLNSLSDEEYAKVLEELGIDAEQDENGEWKLNETEEE